MYPPSLLQIAYCINFDGRIEALPPTLTHLTINSRFNSPITSFPPSLLYLDFTPYKYSHPLPLPFPPNLHTLLVHSLAVRNHLGRELPQSIKVLKIPGPVSDVLRKFPPSLQEITFLEFVAGPIPTLPPDVIINVQEYVVEDEPTLDMIPPKNVKVVEFVDDDSLDYISQFTSLTSLTFSDYFSQPLSSLPNSLRKITFGDHFDFPIDSLPSGVKEISFDFNSAFNQPLPSLPSSLKRITFGKDFNTPVPNLPHSLELIHFGQRFNQRVPSLPPNLETLFFGPEFNQKLENIPKKIKSLVVGMKFNQPLDKLPPNLRMLGIRSYKYTHPLNKLPLSIVHIAIEHACHILTLNTVPEAIAHTVVQYDLEVEASDAGQDETASSLSYDAPSVLQDGTFDNGEGRKKSTCCILQ